LQRLRAVAERIVDLLDQFAVWTELTDEVFPGEGNFQHAVQQGSAIGASMWGPKENDGFGVVENVGVYFVIVRIDNCLSVRDAIDDYLFDD